MNDYLLKMAWVVLVILCVLGIVKEFGIVHPTQMYNKQPDPKCSDYDLEKGHVHFNVKTKHITIECEDPK